MKTELLENTGEFKDSEKVKGLLCHVNKSACRTAKSYGAIANFDQSIKGICLCSEQKVGCLWSGLLLSGKKSQPL